MRVILPPLDKYLFFQPASCFSILSSIDVPIAVDLNWAPNSSPSPKYLIGRDSTIQVIIEYFRTTINVYSPLIWKGG